MLQVKDLIKIYKTKEGAETCALDNIDLSFESTGMTFILGKSGCGKTTLLNLLGGLDTPTEGEILFDGRSSKTFTQIDYDGWRNECVGFVFQNYNLISDLTVGQNVGLALELQGEKADKERVDEALKEVELVDKNGETLYNRRVNELSGGQKQRVAIARALIKNPKLILADEPTGALDSKTGRQLYELLKKVSKDRLVIIVSHDEESAKEYGDRIIEMSDGQVKADNKTAENIAKSERKEHKAEGKLPAKRIFQLGFKGLKHKTFRLAVTMLLTAVCLVALGFCITFYTVNDTRAELNALKGKGIHTFFLSPICREDIWNSHTMPSFSDEQLKKIEETGAALNVCSVNERYEETFYGDVTVKYDSLYDYFYEKPSDKFAEILRKSFYKAVTVNESVDLSKFGYSPDSRFKDPLLCRLPRNENEIALTDFQFRGFKEFGYLAKQVVGVETEIEGIPSIKYMLTEKKINIETPDDLIGLKVGKYTICGVYATSMRYDLEYLEEHRQEFNAAEIRSYLEKFAAGIAFYSEATYPVVYVSPDKIEETRLSDEFFMRFDGKTSAVEKFIKSLDEEYYCEQRQTKAVRTAKGRSCVSQFNPDRTVLNVVTGVTMCAVGPLAIFCALMFMTFLSVNIERRTRELGIMRALGASKRDVVGICLAESFIIAAIDFVASALILGIGCLIADLVLHIPIFIPGILPMLAMFGLAFLTAALGTVIPVVRLAKKKPVEIIRSAE